MPSSPNRTSWDMLQNALALAGEVTCGQAILWAREEGSMLEFVFEDGDLERGKLAEQVKVLTGVMLTFRPKKDCKQIRAKFHFDTREL
jgi:hypothetical protein